MNHHVSGLSQYNTDRGTHVSPPTIQWLGFMLECLPLMWDLAADNSIGGYDLSGQFDSAEVTYLSNVNQSKSLKSIIWFHFQDGVMEN